MKNPVRFFVLSLIFYLLSFISAPAVFAQTNPYTMPNTSPDVPKNMHTWTQNVVIEVLSAFTCQITGIDSVNPNQKCLGADPKTGQIGFVENGGGAIGMMGGMIAVLYTLPIHTTDYFNYLAQNFGVVKPAYAQAVSFDPLSPLIGLWTTFRNLVYLVFVLVFVFIGLAIMLRIKIDPRTVMSIENQIPKIIIGLLLVTFSFAIAGFLIDLMYVLIYLIFNIFGGGDLVKDTTNFKEVQIIFNSNNVLGVFNHFVGYSQVVIESAKGVQQVTQGVFTTTDLSAAVSSLNVAEIIKSVPGLLISGIIGSLAGLIIAIAVLWALFRLWFALIKAYVFLLIDIVLAPFMIVSGVFPGGMGFGGWLRDFLGNLSPFPVTIALFLLGKTFMEAFKSAPTQTFVAPLIGNPGTPDVISSLIGLGIILLAPEVVNMMRTAIKSPEFKYYSAIGQAIGVGSGLAMAGPKNIGGIMTSSKETIATKGPGGTAIYGERGVGRSIASRIFGH